MPNDPKLKFILEVDDKGQIKFKRFGGEIERTAKIGGKFGKKMLAVRKNVSSLALSLGKTAAKASLLGAGLAAAGAAFVAKRVIGEFAAFETSLVRVANVSEESLDKIRARVLDMEPALGSATELVRGYYDVISAGVTEPVKAIDLLTEASKVAKVQQIAQSEVVKALTKVMAGFGGEVATAAEAADLLFTIEKAGQTTVAELVPVIGRLAKQSRDLGISQEELGGSIAQVTQFVGNTDEAATAYQATLTALNKPTTAMKEAFKAMGVESAQAAIKSFGLSGTLERLKDSAGGSSEKMTALFGNVRAIIGVSALADDGFEGLNSRIDLMKEKTGASADAWEGYEGTLNAVWDTFKNTISNQATLLGESLAPKLKEIVETVSAWLEANRDVITQKFSDWITKVSESADRFLIVAKDVIVKVVEWEKESNALIESTKSLFAVLSGFAKAFDVVGTSIGVGLAKYVDFTDAIREATLTDAEINLKLTAELSPKVPLSKGLAKAEDLVLSFGDTVKKLSDENLEITIDGGQVTREVETMKVAINGYIQTILKASDSTEQKLKPSLEFAQAAMSGLAIATQEPINKVKELDDAAENMGRSFVKSSSDAVVALDSITDAMSVVGEATSVPIGRFRTLAQVVDEAAESMMRAAQLQRMGLGGINIGMRQQERNRREIWSFHEGTGPTGLPDTGLFFGHKGEIILNPKESDNFRNVGGGRAGTSNSVTIEDFFFRAAQAAKSLVRTVQTLGPVFVANTSMAAKGMDDLSDSIVRVNGLTESMTQAQLAIADSNLLRDILLSRPLAFSERSALQRFGNIFGLRTQSFEKGTGPSGLPTTGLFFGHKGEIVSDPQESELVRSNVSMAGGVTVEANLNVMFMTGDRASMEMAADSLGDALQRKMKRLS